MIKFLFFFLLWIPLEAFPQKVIGGQTKYQNPFDSLITIQNIAVLPFFDNTKGIYARPLEDYVKESLSQSHQWNLKPFHAVGPIHPPEDFINNPQLVKKIGQKSNLDAFIAARITKGPSGILTDMYLFLSKDGSLLIHVKEKRKKIFALNDIKKMTSNLLNKIKKRIPYDGLVLSRQGERVTLNLGKEDGLRFGQTLPVVQIIKLHRHPKFKFLISAEKEIIGRLRILKVDKTLSFGKIITEIEPGAIQKLAKVSGLHRTQYTNTLSLTKDLNPKEKLLSLPGSKITFGHKPAPWLPQRPPTFGQAGVRLGAGSFRGAMSLSSEELSASDSFYPSVSLEGELWLTSRWSLHALIRQGILETKNPQSGGSPSNLSYSLSSHELLAGYNLRLGPSLWGPHIEFLAGFSSYKLLVDDTNSGFTTMKYDGLKLGVSGSYPITKDHSWSIGTKLFFILNPKLTETPSSSGKSTNTINQFSFLVSKRLYSNLKAEGSLDYELYSSKFSGGAATSSSRNHTTLTAGLFYLF